MKENIIQYKSRCEQLIQQADANNVLNPSEQAKLLDIICNKYEKEGIYFKSDLDVIFFSLSYLFDFTKDIIHLNLILELAVHYNVNI